MSRAKSSSVATKSAKLSFRKGKLSTKAARGPKALNYDRSPRKKLLAYSALKLRYQSAIK